MTLRYTYMTADGGESATPPRQFPAVWSPNNTEGDPLNSGWDVQAGSVQPFASPTGNRVISALSDVLTGLGLPRTAWCRTSSEPAAVDTLTATELAEINRTVWPWLP